MPNWCYNVARVRHEDQGMIDKIANSAESGVLQALVPVPQDLLDTTAGSFGDSEKQAELEAREQANLAKYGFRNWYDWCVANWGTKWDLCEVTVTRDSDNHVTLGFDTAWSPPIEAYAKLEELGFEIEAFYYEPGMAFCGSYQDGCEDTISIEECTHDWVKDNVPREVDEMFGIADEYAQYEAEEDA